jgi:transposase
MTIPGVGKLTAYLLLREIGDIDRFLSAKRLCAYGGLVPRTYQSGEHSYSGATTRQGNRYIRYAMVEAAQLATRKDPALGHFYDRLKRARGAAKAWVAVARKLLVAVYHIFKYGERYRHNSLTKLHLGKPALVSGHVM